MRTKEMTIRATFLFLVLCSAQAFCLEKAAELEYGPFISATIGNQWPKGSFTYKGIAVHLGAVIRETLKDPVKDRELHDPEGGIVFDTDLLRISEGWNGGFLKLQGIPFDMQHGINPESRGTHRFGTRIGPGWAKNGDFTDPRPQPYGPLPADWAKYKGLYRNGSRIVFSYRVGKCDVLESSSLEGGIFYREFTLSANALPQEVLLCETDKADGSNMYPATKTAAIMEGDFATAAKLVGGPAGAELNFPKVSAISLKIPALTKSTSFKVALWSGASKDFDKFSESPLPAVAEDLNQLCQGGPAQWPQMIVGQGVLGAVTNAFPYVVDTLPIVESPMMRTTGFDFYKDGRAAVCTLNGDVWTVSGIDGDLKKVTWRRLASGLFQPLGLKIVDDVVYVLGRDQITRLYDLANSGEADFYENFNNDTQVTENFHEFAMDLQTDAAGNFYYTKAGPVVPGGKGFEKVMAHHGCLLRVSKDGSNLEVVATGLRAANGMSVGPNGEITTADNEGTWVPSSRINFIVPGGFYGCPPLAHVSPEPRTQDPPFCWIPHDMKDSHVDNSSGGQVWVTSGGRWGPLEGQLLHMSYGTSSLFLVLRDSAGGTVQGGTVKFPLQFRTGIMRARFNPKDGQLYVCGVRGWQTNGLKWGGLQRVRYTGGPLYMPVQLTVKPDGIYLTFSSDMDKSIDSDNISIEQWNYKWSAAYGSAHYRPSDPAKEGDDTVEVKDAQLLPDKRTVAILIPRLKPVMQMHIKYAFKTAEGVKLKQEVWNTINVVPDK